jgi:ubiquitin-protein ligase
MIAFNCPGCGRAFNVRLEFAGRKARCKTCGAEVQVPQATQEPALAATAPADETGAHPHRPVEPIESPVPSPKIPLRIRRLTSDAVQMADAFANFDLIKIRQTTGNPTDVYEIEYFVKSLDRGPKNKPVPRDQHLVEIRLTADYPRTAPICKMLTPIFHPNIDPATICVGDHWTAGERLVALVIRIGEMIAFQEYNIRSPLDAEAAMWADLNPDKLPIDARNLHPAEI